MKKLLSLTLCVVLALGLCAPALAAEVGIPTPVDDIIILPEPGEPTLTLVVNGVPSEAELTVENWVTYVSVADARALLGEDAVDPDTIGLVPLRELAEAAGWDVAWYDGGWLGLDQQVCLWNKAAFLEEIDADLGPFRQFVRAFLDAALANLNTPQARKTVENVTAEITRFSTLDGNRKYTLRARSESVSQKGVSDTVSYLDLTDLATLFSDPELAALAEAGEMSEDDLLKLLSAGKGEYIVDTNTGGVATKLPWLGLIDSELADWQVVYLPGFGEDLARLAEMDAAELFYDEMLEQAEWSGGVYAREQTEEKLALLRGFVGGEHFQVTSDGSWTYYLTTEQANRGIREALGVDDRTVQPLKKCEVLCHVYRDGRMDISLNYRPDVDELARLEDAEPYGLDGVLESVMRRISPDVPDVAVNLRSAGTPAKSETTLEVHWNNVGMLRLTGKSETGTADRAPRQVQDVERHTVYDPKGPQL